MIDRPIILGQAGEQPLELDLDRLIGSHLGIVANAGGGKSGLIRRLLEQTHGRIQQIVLDIEDEFYSLRERYDYVIAGGDGDAPATVDNAAALARGALEHGFSLICQLNDLGGQGAREFVDTFLSAMLTAPRDLWRPCLIVIDETQRFDSDSIRMLTERGRKRGFTAVLASQRLPKIDANIRGDLNNWIMGRVGQSLDRRIMADQLGMTKAGERELASIQPRHFWAMGPALSPDPVLFEVADVETTMVRPGQAKVATPPAPEALREILAGLAAAKSDSQIPTDAAMGDNRISDLMRVNAERAETIAGQLDEIADLEERVEQITKERDKACARAEHLDGCITAAVRALGYRDIEEIGRDRDEQRWADTLQPARVVDAAPKREAIAAPTKPTREVARPAPANSARSTGETATPPGTRPTLSVLASVYPAGMTRGQLAARVGIKKTGTTFGSYLSRLRTNRLIEDRDGLIFASETGAAAIGDVAPLPPPGPALARSWASKLPGTGPVVEYLLARHPAWCDRGEIADALGINRAGTTLGSYVSRLSTAGVIEKSGSSIRLSAEVMG